MTQFDYILTHLETGRSITPAEAWSDYGCTRLAAVIHKLKKQGYSIRREMEQGQNRLGDTTYYARYWMLEGVKQNAGHRR